MLSRLETRLFIVAICAFLLAGLVYYLDRPSESIYFIPDWLPVNERQYHLFGSTGNYLPVFLHAFVFILFTCACLLPSRKQLILVCAAWFTIDLLFEIAQSAPAASWSTSKLTDHRDEIPLLENIPNYFLTGVFDIQDICAIAAGTIAAYLTVLVAKNKYSGEPT